MKLTGESVDRGLALGVCALSLAGSIYGLWHVCIELAKMPEIIAVAVIAAFDGSAIVFGRKVAADPKAVTAWGGVILCAALSAAAQILAAPAAAGDWRFLHGAPAIAAIWTLHNAVKEAKPPKRGRTGQAGGKRQDTRSKGAGSEATGAGPQATAPAGPPAVEPSHDASVIRLHTAGREGERRASGHDAAPPNHTVESMADAVAPLLGEANPSQRRVWDLCKSIDPGWTQANGRAVSAELQARRERTG